jgi:hypothetical protein
MEVGDRVFYRDNGQEDTGTVKAIICVVEHFVYQVKWENDTNETAFLYSRYQLHSPKHFPQVGDEAQITPLEAELLEEAEIYNESDTQQDGMISSRVVDMLSELRIDTTNPNEILCIDSISRVFEMVDNIDFLNKSAVLLYLRELSGLTSKQLTTALQSIKRRYRTKRGIILDF